MDQIKKVFSPGSTKDDELMYGSEESRLQNAADNEAKKDHSTLYPTEEHAGQEKESGGVLHQIVNPGGKKYDEQAMGTTATTEQPDPSKLQTDPDHQDHGILKQLTNPERKAYDDTAHGTTAATGDSSAMGSSSLANDQSTLPLRDTTSTTTTADSNLGGNAAVAGGGAAAAAGAGGIAAQQYSKHDNDTTGGGQADGLADDRTGTQAAQDQSGSHGAGRDVGSASVVDRTHDNNPDKGATILAATGTTSQSRPLGDSNLTGGNSTGYDQPSTLSTGSTLTGTESSDNTFSSGQTASESHIGRDAGIAGELAAAGVGAGAYDGRNDAASSLTDTTGAGTSESIVGQQSHHLTSGTTHGHINPVGAPEASLGETGGLSERTTHAGGAQAGVLGSPRPNSGVAAGGVRNNEGTTQLNQAPADVQGATFLDRSFYVGNPGDRVGHGPNVPGEFPAAASESSTSGIAQTAGTAGLAQDSAFRDTAAPVVSGVGASSVAQPASTTATTTTTHGSTTPRSDIAQTGVPATARDLKQDISREDHHYGRDAAVAGGVGAAVAGADIAGRDRVEPGTTTHEAYGTEDPNKHNKLHKQPHDDKKLEKELAKEEKHHQKELAKEEKHHQKELAKEEKHHQKELEKQQHEAQKQHEKDAKERQHAAEKAEKKHEKELEKQHEKEEKDKKPSLIDRILHRNKDDKQEVVYTDEKAGEPLHIKENTENGPLDHPLVTTATASTAAGAAGAAGVAGASAYQTGQQHSNDSRTSEPLNITENNRNGPLDHPLVTAAGTLTGTGAAGASADQARPQHSTASDLTGQRQRDVEPLLSGSNNAIGSTTTTSTATAGGVDATSGMAATQATPTAYQQGGQTTSDLTGQRQRDVEPLLSGNNNAIGSSTTGTSSAVAGSALAAGGVAGAGALSTGGDSHIEGQQAQSGGSAIASGDTGSGLTGRRQDDVDPYIHSSNN